MSRPRRVGALNASYRLDGFVLAALALNGYSAAGTTGRSAAVLQGRLGDLDAVTQVIGRGRRISPIGMLAGTANFPSSVVARGAAYVPADGATQAQSVARYAAGTLISEGTVLAVPGAVKAAGRRAVRMRGPFLWHRRGPIRDAGSW